MSAYEVKLDARGRLLLPKPLRAMLGDSVHIEHEPEEDWFTVSSAEPKKIIGSAWVEGTDEQIIDEAWSCGVFWRDDEAPDKTHHHIEVYGTKSDIEMFFVSLGVNEEDIKYE